MLRIALHFILTVAVAAAFMSHAAVAGPLKLTDGDTVRLQRNANTYGGANGGGAFQLSGVDVAAGPGDSFLTFCLEASEQLSLGTTYFVSVNDRAIGGGASAAASYTGDVSGVIGSYDPLSPATAWLYTQFRNNTLHQHVTFNYQSNDDVNALQAAIWSLESETNVLDSKATLLRTKAVDAGWTSINDVRVLNLWTNRTGTSGAYQFSGHRQDQLVLVQDLHPVAVPEPSSIALCLLGSAAVGFAASRNRRLTRAARCPPAHLAVS